MEFKKKGQTMEAGITAFTTKLQGEMESARQVRSWGYKGAFNRLIQAEMESEQQVLFFFLFPSLAFFLFLLPLPPSSQAEMFREAQDPTKRPGGMADTVRVVVQGTSRDDLNGQTGTIASYDPIAELYHVVLGKYGFILYIAILLYWSLCL